MAAENFNTFLETDPGSVIAVTSSRVTWTDIRAGQDNTHVSLDKGAAFFDASFVHNLTISQTASERGGSYSIFWALTNVLDDFRGLEDANEDGLFVFMIHNQSPNRIDLVIQELDGGTFFDDGTTGLTATDGTTYYITITRDETSGSFGSITLQVYTDFQRTTLVNTQTFALNTSKKDFRYVMVGQSRDETGGTTKKASGYSEDLDLSGISQGVTPVVGTTVPTDIDATSATGRGTIVDLGLAAVTAHGMVWDTSAIDTAVVPGSQPNSTDEGAGAVGGFTSSITGLAGGTIYFARAYATNSFGTGYGGGVQWKSGASYSTKEWGDTSMKGNELHTVGEDGVERAHMGTPV